MMKNIYDERYAGDDYYWGLKPSSNCRRVLELMPPGDGPLKLLDAGCGEGRDAVFFARAGYAVTAFDLSPAGIGKTLRLARGSGVVLDAFVADINDHRLDEGFDVVFSTGVLQYIPGELRGTVLANYREHTRPGGINALSVFVKKPFIPRAPDAEPTAHDWYSGELLSHYRDWRIEYTSEEIFDCGSGGVPHRHAISRVIARRVAGS